MNSTLIESLVFLKAKQQDYSQIMMMHNENLNTVLTDQEKASGGVLSVPLRVEDSQVMNQEIAVVVASCGERLSPITVLQVANTINLYHYVPI